MSSNARHWRGVIFVLVVVVLALATLHHYGANRRLARLAIETAQSSGLLDREVGTSLSMAILVHGRVVEGANGGNADLKIPVSGDAGGGTLFAWEQRDRESWRICSLSFRSKGGLSIVIVSDESSHCERE
ncbi:MAG: cytochrome c oxidase assembly factor Coa1 family protein [Acidobacteriaceae bacterium]